MPSGRVCFPTDSDTHLLDRLNAIYKYRYVVVTVFLLVLLAVAVRTFTTTPMFRATTSVLIEDERAASVAGFNSATNNEYVSDPEPYYQTQLRILTGRELAAKVVARLNLAVGSRVQRSGSAADRPGLGARHDEAAGAGRRRAGHRGRASDAAIGARDERRRRARQQFPRRGHRRSGARQPALQRLGSVGRSRVRGEGRRHARRGVREAELRAAHRGDARRASQFLSDEIKKQQTKVEDSERAMAQYRETNNALSLEDRPEHRRREPQRR